jgi:hypothetical protein
MVAAMRHVCKIDRDPGRGYSSPAELPCAPRTPYGSPSRPDPGIPAAVKGASIPWALALATVAVAAAGDADPRDVVAAAGDARLIVIPPGT